MYKFTLCCNYGAKVKNLYQTDKHLKEELMGRSSTAEELQPELLGEYRFNPPDDKMAKLLKNKTEGKHSPINHKPWGDICGITNQVVLLFLSFFKELMQGLAIIPEIDVYKFDAWDLPERLFPDSPYQAREWFAYSRPDYKYTHSSSTCNRTTEHGFWKVTSQPRRINSEFGTCFKRTITFHEGRVSKSKRTCWVMQEYYFSETEGGDYPNQQKRALVLCRLRRNKPAKNKSDTKKLKDTSMSYEPFDPTGTGGYIVSNSDYDQTADAAAAIAYVTSDPEEHLPHKELDAQEIDDMTQCPQISHHSSPQVDQQSLLTHPKAGTLLQTASSPVVILSPSTPIAPCPMPGDLDKPSSLSNAGNIGHHQKTTGVGSQAQSLAIGTPGISASPLLAEFSVPDGTHVNALSTNSGKSILTEQPFQRLIKALKSISSNALSASVSDIRSVVSMSDRIAGSGPGVMTPNGVNGTRKRRRYTSAVPSGYIVSNSDNDQAADAASAFTYMPPDPDPEEHPPHKELEAQEIENTIQGFGNCDPPRQLGNCPTYERSSEVFSQWDETLDSLFHSFQPQNNTSQPQTLYSEQGDFQHPNNYIGCYGPQSQYLEIAPLFP